MKNKSLLAVILVMALVTLACGINIELPGSDVKTGPTETKDIRVEKFEDPDTVADVELSFGAGEIILNPGAQNALIEGTATYNVGDFEPEVNVFGNNIQISQGELEIRGIPDFDKRIVNEWDLQLGDAPMELKITAGAYQGNYDLGGLALHALEINDGAAQANLSFSEENLITMDSFRYTTGASDVRLTGLANANFEKMIFRGGAGSFRLDFSGNLQQDASVEIESGISSLTIIIPEGTNTEIRFEGGLTDINPQGEWRVSGNTYSLSGSGPKLDITVKMGAGSLELRSSR